MSTTRWTESEGLEFVRQWRRSGQSISAFARERGENVQRLRYWRERVEGQLAKASSELIPGVVVGMREQALVTVHMSRGVVVEVHAAGEVEPAWLAELARALENVS
jgi:transposase-like protein